MKYFYLCREYGLVMVIDEKVFQGFVKGQEKSFEIIFSQYYKTLVSLSMRYGLEQMEAEDVVIEVIHRIWEIRKEIKSPAALNSLLYTSVHNRTLNVVRNLKNRERIIYIRNDKKEEEEFEDYLLEEEVCRLLDEAVQALPPRCQLVILELLNGKTMKEIAVEMQLSLNTVKTYKLRAIEILRTKFARYPLLLWMILLRLS